MSYIYEALKQAEDEHKRGAVAVRATGRRTLFGGRAPWWLWALIGVLGANVIVLATLAVTLGYRWPGARVAGTEKREATVTAPVAARPPAPPGSARATVAEDRQPGLPARVEPPATVSPVGPAVSPGPVTRAPAMPEPPVAPRSHASPGRPAGSRATAPPAVAPPPAPPAVSMATPPAVVPPPAAAVAPPVGSPVPPGRGESAGPSGPGHVPVRTDAGVPSRVDRQPAPPRAEARVDQDPPVRGGLPAESRPVAPEPRAAEPAAAVEPPKVTLQVIVYSDVPSQRMVFIDGQRYAEGDSLDAETVLERINSDGAVFRRRGVRFVIAGRRD